MDRIPVEPVRVVVELEAVAEVSVHALSVRRRKPPWYSYDVVTTGSASRRARSREAERDGVGERLREQGLDPGDALRGDAERLRPPGAAGADGAARARRVADEARPSAPHSAQLVRCGR